jgi:hypothetical protein
VAPPLAADIHQRSDGMWAVGLDDETAAGPFESRTFALAVAEQVRLAKTRHDPRRCRP